MFSQQARNGNRCLICSEEKEKRYIVKLRLDVTPSGPPKMPWKMPVVVRWLAPLHPVIYCTAFQLPAAGSALPASGQVPL